MVTEPDFHSADEAVAFLETMRSIYQYANISEADSKKGQVRCDVNVSIMDDNLDESDPNNWGTKIEIKNVNSFGGVRDAINYEIQRQIDLKEDGKYDEMPQQTRRWDEESGTTIYMRSKVDAIDYKYFVEPNIPKFKISSKWLEEIRSCIPRLASERKKQYMEDYGVSEYDATILVKEKNVADFFEKTIELGGNAKSASNWITTNLLGTLNKLEISIDECKLTPEHLAELIKMVEMKEISSQQAKGVFTESLEKGISPKEIAKEKGLKQITDSSLIENLVNEVLDENPDIILQYKNGKTQMVNYLVGQVMKKSKGTANPSMAREVMAKEIEKR